MIYEFKTTTTMKPYNRDKWWIMGNVVKDVEVEADSLESALEKWREKVECVDISKNALKTKEPMYVDRKDGTCKQVGYVITGSSLFDDDCGHWTKQYVECWVSIRTVSECF